jgi:outer membrane receptor protein involved in Fe transport
MIKKITLSAFAACTLVAAEQKTPLLDEIKDDIAEISKTATETRKNINYLPHIMSVFEQKELREAGAQTLKDALVMVGGVEMSVDSMGVYNPVFRGSNPYAFGQSKLIVDGVEVNDLFYDGYTPYLSMPIELIKRVEVIRGPGAFAVGHNSYAGSIVVTTFQEQIDKPSFDSQVYIGGGSYGQRRGGASYSYQKDDLSFFVDAYAYKDEQKLIYGDDVLSTGRFGHANVHLTQNGYTPTYTDTKSLSMFLSDKNVYFKARVLEYKHGGGGGISYALTHDNDYYKLPRYTIDMGYKYSIGSADGELRATMLEDHFVLEGITAPAGIVLATVTYSDGIYRYIEAKLRSYVVENSFKQQILGGNAAYGIKAKWDKVIDQETDMTNRTTGVGVVDYSDTLPFFDENGFISTATAYMDYDYDISKKLSANFALSAEKRNKLNGMIEPRLSLIYSVSDTDRLKMFVSKAHRNPSWQEMYMLNNQSRVGNKDLKPEIVYAYEAQYIKQLSVSSSLSFDIFYLRNYDQINKLNANTYQNDGRSDIRGFETEWRGQFEDLTFYAAYSYQHGIDQNGRRLANTAEHTAKAHAIYSFGQFAFGSLAFRYSGDKIREVGDNREPLKAYLATDVSIGYKLKELGEFELSAKNIFNQTIKYPSEPVTYTGDYPSEGVNAYLTFRSRF